MKCRNGHAVRSDMKFCPECGNSVEPPTLPPDLSPVPSSSPSTVSPNPHRGIYWAIGAGVAVVTAIGIGAAVNSSSPEHDSHAVHHLPSHDEVSVLMATHPTLSQIRDASTYVHIKVICDAYQKDGYNEFSIATGYTRDYPGVDMPDAEALVAFALNYCDPPESSE